MNVATKESRHEREAELSQRADRTPDPDELEPSYAESVRRYHARRRDARLWEWLRYHEAMLENHGATFMALLERHKAGLAECEAALGIRTSNERKETA